MKIPAPSHTPDTCVRLPLLSLLSATLVLCLLNAMSAGCCVNLVCWPWQPKGATVRGITVIPMSSNMPQTRLYCLLCDIAAADAPLMVSGKTVQLGIETLYLTPRAGCVRVQSQ